MAQRVRRAQRRVGLIVALKVAVALLVRLASSSQQAVVSGLESIDLAPFAPGTKARANGAQPEIACVQGATRVQAGSCERTPTTPPPHRLGRG